MEPAPDAPPGYTADQQHAQRQEKLTSHSLGVHRISTARIFPESRSPPHQIPLSILDTSSFRSPACSAAWLYDQPVDEQGRAASDVAQLQESLKKTLSAYPQWAGELHLAPAKPGGD